MSDPISFFLVGVIVALLFRDDFQEKAKVIITNTEKFLDGLFKGQRKVTIQSKGKDYVVDKRTFTVSFDGG